MCRSEEHTSEFQSRQYLVCRLLLEKKKTHNTSKTAVTTSMTFNVAAPHSPHRAAGALAGEHCVHSHYFVHIIPSSYFFFFLMTRPPPKSPLFPHPPLSR